MPTTDPLGLERCAICTNAFEYDADKQATKIWRASGRAGFVCDWCAWQYRAEFNEAEKELAHN